MPVLNAPIEWLTAKAGPTLAKRWHSTAIMKANHCRGGGEALRPGADSVIRELFLIALNDITFVSFTCVGAQMVKCAPGVIADCIKPTYTVERM